MYERYRIWRKKVEFIFCSALADSTPKQLVSYLKYWMGDQGIPLIEKWESTGKLDYSNSRETPATEGGRRKTLSSGYKLQTYWDLLDEEFKPKGNKLLSIIELWTRSKQGDKPLNQWLTQIYNLVNITPVAPETFRTFQSFMTFQPFQAILQCSSISRESTPFQHSPIRMHILHILQFLQVLQFDWFPQKLHRVPVGQLQTLQTLHSSKKGRCCDIGQIDRFSIIELNPSFVLSSDNTNCKNDIQLFLQLFDELSVYRDYH